jgi:tRNA(Ile)-lysidine synthase
LEAREHLGIVLSVVHLNHQLRGDESDGDELFVAEMAASHDLPFHCEQAETLNFARERELSVEAAARELRYAFFGRLIQTGILDKVATAHTADDQAETVLLRIMRGTGTSGLAGVLPRLVVGPKGEDPKGIVRPLLETRRRDLKTYLERIGRTWREDSTNSEAVYTRNRLRQLLLPAMEREFNPEIVESLANLAEVARAEDEFWAEQTAAAFVRCFRNNGLEISLLLDLPVALQRRVLRLSAMQAGANLDFEHCESVRAVLSAAHGRKELKIDLPEGFRAEIGENRVIFTTDEPRSKPCGFAYSVHIPGEVAVPELGVRFRFSVVDGTSRNTGYNADNLDQSLALRQLTHVLTVRNWRPGDRFWPVHSRTAKKVKELLSNLHVTGRQKASWPVVVAGDDIVWMRGFPVAREYQAGDGQAVRIEELPLFPQ